ncbi:MAG TPA: hypothetical protein VIC62_00245 [Nakamurella sp.]
MTVLEQLPELIDFPRRVVLDDQSLRSLKAMGLVDKVLRTPRRGTSCGWPMARVR